MSQNPSCFGTMRSWLECMSFFLVDWAIEVFDFFTTDRSRNALRQTNSNDFARDRLVCDAPSYMYILCSCRVVLSSLDLVEYIFHHRVRDRSTNSHGEMEQLASDTWCIRHWLQWIRINRRIYMTCCLNYEQRLQTLSLDDTWVRLSEFVTDSYF